jgi:hypothetical protein
MWPKHRDRADIVYSAADIGIKMDFGHLSAPSAGVRYSTASWHPHIVYEHAGAVTHTEVPRNN